MWRWKLRCGIGIGLFAVLWLFTGGCAVIRYQQVTRGYHDNNSRPLIIVNSDRRQERTIGIPYVFMYYTDVIPLPLNFTYITHDVVQKPKLLSDDKVVEQVNTSFKVNSATEFHFVTTWMLLASKSQWIPLSLLRSEWHKSFGDRALHMDFIVHSQPGFDAVLQPQQQACAHSEKNVTFGFGMAEENRPREKTSRPRPT
jgi:hypothetical protein